MFDVISSYTSTNLHSFPNLQSKCTYLHAGDGVADFQVFSGKNGFMSINKKSGFELLQTLNENGTDSIQRLKKCQVDDLECGAVSKLNVGSELALGTSTGYIRIFNTEKANFMPVKLNAEKSPVVGLDYSICDQYLAALYDNFTVNIFGLKTGVKTDAFRCDENGGFVFE